MTGVLALGAILVVVVAIVTLWTTFRAGKGPRLDAAADPEASARLPNPNVSLKWQLGLLGIGALIVATLFWVAARAFVADKEPAQGVPAPSVPYVVMQLPGTPRPPGPSAEVTSQPGLQEEFSRLREQMASLQESQRALIGSADRPITIWSLAVVSLVTSVAGSLIVLMVYLVRRAGPRALGPTEPSVASSDSDPPSPEASSASPEAPSELLLELRARRATVQDRIDQLQGALGWHAPKSGTAPRFVLARPRPDPGTANTAAAESIDIAALLDELSAALGVLERSGAELSHAMPTFEWHVPEPNAYPAESLRILRADLVATLQEVERLLGFDAARRLGPDRLAESLRAQLRRLREMLVRRPRRASFGTGVGRAF